MEHQLSGLNLKDNDLHLHIKGVSPTDCMPSFANYLERRMNEFLLQGESRYMNRARKLPKPFRALRHLQENLGGVNSQEITDTHSPGDQLARRNSRFPVPLAGRPGTLPTPPPSLRSQPLLLLHETTQMSSSRRRHKVREEIPLIQPTRIRSLFAILNRMSWEEDRSSVAAAATTVSATASNIYASSPPVQIEGSGIEKVNNNSCQQDQSDDKESLQMLYPEGEEEVEVSTHSTSELFVLASEDAAADLPTLLNEPSSRQPCMTVDRALNLTTLPPRPSQATTVLINGMTPEELLNIVRYEHNREGTIGYYGPQEYERDQQKRRIEEQAQREAANKARDQELGRRRAALRGRASFPMFFWDWEMNTPLRQEVKKNAGWNYFTGWRGTAGGGGADEVAVTRGSGSSGVGVLVEGVSKAATTVWTRMSSSLERRGGAGDPDESLIRTTEEAII